ncbi:MAG: hypothetical protein AAFR76_15005 [Planctomycetota bacterium]
MDRFTLYGTWCRLMVLALAAVIAQATPGEHPQDGPHVDIRLVVSDQDVRMTLGLNLPFLDAALPTSRELASDVAPSEEALVLGAVRRLVAEDTRITIDGTPVEPSFERLDIERMSEDSIYLFPNSGRSALTRFNVVAVYPCQSPPQQIDIEWSHYPPSVLSEAFEEVGDSPPPMVIDAQLRAQGRARVIRFSETDRIATWRAGGDTPETAVERLPEIDVHAGTAIPIVSLGILVLTLGAAGLAALSRKWLAAIIVAVIGLAGAAAASQSFVRYVDQPDVPDEQAIRLFAILHSNIYRAFDFTAENDIYDTLAISVTGDLLDSLYRQIRLGLVQAENGGGVGRVTALDLRSAEVISEVHTINGVAFEILAEWDVEGTVYHFGHSHAKQTPYAGIFRVAQTPEGWRIDQAEPRERDGLFVTPGDL